VDRRSFVKKIAQMSAGIALAAHLNFPSLVPIPEIKEEKMQFAEQQQNFSIFIDPTTGSLRSKVWLEGTMLRAET